MNKLRYVVALFAMVLPWPAIMQSQQPAAAQAKSRGSGAAATSWKQIPISPLRPFQPQEPRRVELPNATIIFLQEDHELPLIDGTIRIRGGFFHDAADKSGLAGDFMEGMATGG